MQDRKNGFTLVELAIVLVIVSLLMGGILKGQELISSAKAKSMAGDMRAAATAYFSYLDRFRAVPGDDGAADSHVNGTNASSGGTVGNGRIEGSWASATRTDESYLFWQHVRLAGLLTGSTAAVIGGAANPAYLPTNADGGRLGISAASPITDTGYGGNFLVCSGNVNGRLARQIDSILDDGVGNSGSVRILAMGSGVTTTGTSTETLDAGALYIVCMAN